MAILWMDDFTSYGTGSSSATRMRDGLYAETASGQCLADPDPSVIGGFCLYVGGNAALTSSIVRKVLPSAVTTVGVAARYFLQNLPSSTGQRPYFVAFKDVNASLLCYLTSDPSGYLEAYNSAGTLLGRSTNPVVVPASWRHMETKCFLSATVGTIQVKLEGTTVMNLTGVNTSPSGNGCQNIAIQNLGQFSPNFYIKDYIVWDSSGAVNNDFMGSCKVFKIVPDGDSAFPWVASSGSTGWNLINESTPSDDTGYISADPTPPAASNFTLTDVPVDVTTVRGVMSVHRTRKLDGGDGNIQVGIDNGTTVDNGVDRPMSTAYTYWTDVHNLAPDGGNWSRIKVNAVKLKINRTL